MITKKQVKIFSLLLFIFFLFECTVLLASNNTQKNNNYYKLTGLVKNHTKQKFPFVYVFIKEHPQIKIATELDGTFILTVPDSIKLPFSLIFTSTGYIPQSYKITNKNKLKKIQITLRKPKKKVLNNTHASEDKFTGAGTLKKSKNKLMYESSETTGIALRTMTSEAADVLGSNAKLDAAGAVPEIGMLPPPTVTQDINISSGLLTAGEINDFTKWTLWTDITTKELEQHQKEWKMFPDKRYVAQLTNLNKMPIVDALVFLKDNQGNTIWQARTDNTGKAELWAKMLDDGILNTGQPYTLLFSHENKTVEIEAIAFPKRINSAELNITCNKLKQVDVQFIVDATGSMGDEIKYLQAELYDVIEKVKKNNTSIDLRTGSVFYRDLGDEYVTRTSNLDKDINKTIEFIKKQEAGGGGDYPEALDIALTEAIENGNWHKDALARIAFLILDAQPHQDTASIERVHRQVRLAAMKGIRIVPLVCSGADKSAEFLMRSIALATNGTYVFLTDESGIGAPHMKPTTDKYKVEKLNHILLRIITEFSQFPDCDNNWDDWTKDINSQEEFIPKPYKESPEAGVERLNLDEVINIYPNPCNGELKINLLQDATDIYLIDITGKSLQNFNLEKANSINLNLYDYSVGTYFINIYHRGYWYTIKFLLIK